MSLNANHEQQSLHLQRRLGRAPTMTADRMAEVIARACTRFPAPQTNTKTRIAHLIRSGAFTDAALALLELELPQWKLRRLLFADGEWHCSLSRQPSLPVEFDEMAEAAHEILPLAILSAFLEARRCTVRMNGGVARSALPVRPAQGCVVCCDNFA